VRSDKLDAEALERRLRPGAFARRVGAEIDRILAPRPTPVINATGVVVHTNLGRSVLGRAAADRLARAASGYLDLEYDLARGARGRRGDHLAPLLDVLFPGAEAIVVNNNASAILLALRALARRREVVLSRGELVEIGGSFRVPEIFAASGAKLREVGTTNRTRLSDYAAAVGPKTAALLKVHTSNFRIVGFTEETSVTDLAGLAREAGVPLIVDWGSGDLIDLGPLGIDDETPVAEILAAGADVVTFSGDKLLGGPQAGIAVGRPESIARMRRDPMARVCRLDRLRIAALHETLSAYVRGRAFDEVPTLRMLALEPDAIGARAQAVVERLGDAAAGVAITVEDGVSRTGGGSSPTGERATRLLAIDAGERDAHRIERALRRRTPPVIARVHDGRVLLDLRTVPREEDCELARALGDALRAVRRARP
jgi:L-seryl-tRNA(Ser) seleniumtransferase